MKKSSLMGASVVAAALLAAAPVVAPVASLATPGTQVVKADDATDKQNLTNYTNKLIGSLKGSSSVDKPELLNAEFVDNDFAAPTTEYNTTLVGTDGKIGLSDGFSVSNGIASQTFNRVYLQSNSTIDTTGAERSVAASNLRYTLTYTASYGNGRISQLYSRDEVSKVVKDLQKNGGTLTANYKFYDKHDNSLIGSADPVATFKPDALSHASFVKVNDVTVPYGTLADTFNTIGSIADNGGQFLNEKGENVLSSLNTSQVGVSKLRYDYVPGEYTGSEVPAGTSLKEGVYTQEIKFNPGNIFGGNNLDAADAAGRISYNGYSLADIKANKAPGMKYDQPSGWVFITRKVTVGKAGVTDAPYTAEKVDGIVTVTTKEGTAAQVYDQAGNPVYSRALAPGSRWITGQKRTLLKNGKVYYQVSTNEFLSADDVSYTANSASTSDHIKGAVKVTQIGNKVFTVADGNYGYVWAKDDDNNGMHLVKSRFLAPNSKWQSGAKANMTDSEGNTHEFYQVSTNEWIDGSVGSIN